MRAQTYTKASNTKREKNVKSLSGRPTVITSEVVRKLETAFKEGLSVSEACIVSGISRDTFYIHLKHNEDFSDKMTRSQAYITIKAKKAVICAINQGNLHAAKWWLEHKASEEFGRVPIKQVEVQQYQNRYEGLSQEYIERARKILVDSFLRNNKDNHVQD